MLKQPLITELRTFINSVSNLYRGLPTPPEVPVSQLVRSSLTLLEELPSSRELVLEYFAAVFDTSVKNYMILIDKEPQNTQEDDENITDIQEALENLIRKGPGAWPPLISSWSLRILGSLSGKYSQGRPKDIGSSCTLWLGSSAMRCLLSLAASCFVKLNSAETEECITTLLGTFVQYTPYFDWVVARLGGCFPLRVISKILQCGLKGFVGNSNSTLDSEVGILAYLSFGHENDLKYALNEMLQTVLSPNAQLIAGQPIVNTIPYFLHLCSMSEILLQPIVSVFLALFNESIIPVLVNQTVLWPPNFNVHEIIPQLSTLTLKLKTNGLKTILKLANLAEKYIWCQEFLENILQELEYTITDNRNSALSTELRKNEDKMMMWKSCSSSIFMEQQTAVRLLLLVSSQAPYIYHQTIVELLSKPYRNKNNYGLGALIRIINGLHPDQENAQIRRSIEMALERIILEDSQRLPTDHKNRYLSFNILNNLVKLIKLEEKNTIHHLLQKTITTSVTQCLSKILEMFSKYLKKNMHFIESFKLTKDNWEHQQKPLQQQQQQPEKHEESMDINKKDTEFTPMSPPIPQKRFKFDVDDDDEFPPLNEQDVPAIQTINFKIHKLAELLNLLEIGKVDHNKMSMIDVIRLAQSTVKYFFWSLIEKDLPLRLIAVNRCYTMLSRQCVKRKSTCTVALRELLEGALYLYCNLFAGYNADPNVNNDSAITGRTKESIMKLNQKQGITSSTVRSTLYARSLGNDLKSTNVTEPQMQFEAQIQNMFLNAITACCKSDDIPHTVDCFSTVSLLLVEMVSTDVMYNGLPWPEEEFTKVTMERDLQIRSTFKTVPILWSILSLVAGYRPSLCYTSVLLRALCASVLHQWRAKTVDKYQTIENNMELFNVTKKLLEILAMGQLLTPPLSSIHTVLEYLEPAEIALVLKECVWNYMKENVPTPVIFFVDNSGFGWRHDLGPHPKFIDPLRNIMQRKLPEIGILYYHMFVLPQLNENMVQKSNVITIN